MRRWGQRLKRKDEFQGDVLKGKFNRNERQNKKDVRQAVLIIRKMKTGRAKKTGKKKEK